MKIIPGVSAAPPPQKGVLNWAWGRGRTYRSQPSAGAADIKPWLHVYPGKILEMQYTVQQNLNFFPLKIFNLKILKEYG